MDNGVDVIRSSQSSAAPARNLVVFSRGLDLRAPADQPRLSPASLSRVKAVLRYVEAHADSFRNRSATGQPGRIVFSGGFASAAAGTSPTPSWQREGRLMLEAAREGDVDGDTITSYAECFAEPESESTLENVLQVHRRGYFADEEFTPDNPLGLVAHRGHLRRIDYFTRKIFGLRAESVRHIVASGTDQLSRGLPEPTLYGLTRLACAGAASPTALRRRERLMLACVRLVSRK